MSIGPRLVAALAIACYLAAAFLPCDRPASELLRTGLSQAHARVEASSAPRAAASSADHAAVQPSAQEHAKHASPEHPRGHDHAHHAAGKTVPPHASHSDEVVSRLDHSAHEHSGGREHDHSAHASRPGPPAKESNSPIDAESVDSAGVAVVASSDDAPLSMRAVCLCGCGQTRSTIGGNVARLGAVVPGLVYARLIEAPRPEATALVAVRISETTARPDPIPI